MQELLAAYDAMLEQLRVTEGNIRSLGPAGAIPWAYEIWLEEVQRVISLAESSKAACGKESGK
ncbi:hypothetical protein [Nitratidesulfovibrio liaohensis]|uniref:Uncharacterized protein n=1 Tax=Nitratidesulfovibrio liaohensis TaxID=2604158 RepID=A0ABY9QXX5_9BACT|nr:hypothetical protein [Nitratidesulfovibrio liaohensis]WMW64375.1 hypothetical protein KPS_002387 [Nitratidesulfovibrio liaohensis]